MEATLGIVVITVHVLEALDIADKFPAASVAVPAFTMMPRVPSPLAPLVIATTTDFVPPPLLTSAVPVGALPVPAAAVTVIPVSDASARLTVSAFGLEYVTL
jgi:hypothetical protein